MNELKKQIKMANKVLGQLQELRSKRWQHILNGLSGLCVQFDQMRSASQKLILAIAHEWFAAADECLYPIGRSVDELRYWLDRARQMISAAKAEVPKLSMLVAELRQLQQELGSVEFDAAEGLIAVETDPITLEEVYLGPFRIELEIGKLGDLYGDIPYKVIALDPHPAATDEDVTHPHVKDDSLCEGDGHTAIRSALEQGRLCDFFTLVQRILNTYSPHSPYIPLSEWDGTTCNDCGCVCSSEDSCYCQFCEGDYCDDCVSSCRNCDQMVCRNCSQLCAACQQTTCPSCITECPKCKRMFCSSCLEEGLCPDCQEELENENEQPDQSTDNGVGEVSGANQPGTGSQETAPISIGTAEQVTDTLTEVQPDSVGEAVVLQG